MENNKFNQYQYPENGSVVIVDDMPEEALPLMKVLAKMNISFKYFMGKAEELPDKPFDNVRILFLDIELEGMSGVTEDKTKLSALGGVIEKIISPECQPYIIIAWTKHQELKEELNKYLINKPLFILCIDKADCKINNDSFDINKISEQIQNKAKEFDSFVYFLNWQNIINSSSHKLINEISSIYSYDENWNNNIKTIFNLLSKGYAGEQGKEDIEKYSMLCFNNLLFDIVENKITSQSSVREINIQPAEEYSEDDKLKGELNRRLHISSEKSKTPIPGNIYKLEDIHINLDKEQILKDIIQNQINDDEKNKLTVNLILLEVSPFCDYAQNKWKMHRMLAGVRCSLSSENKTKKADFIYKTPLFNINNELIYLVFDIKYLTSISPELLKDKESIMRIRKELLNDIQSKIAGHINRLGITGI